MTTDTERSPAPDWYDAQEGEPGQAASVSLADRVDYLTVIACRAGAGLGRAALRQLCYDLELPDRETELVLGLARRGTEIKPHLRALRHSPLRFSLLSDCMSLAYSGGAHSERAYEEIHALARDLRIDAAQTSALGECYQYLQAMRLSPGDEWGDDPIDCVDSIIILAERLEAVGIPSSVAATASAVGAERAVGGFESLMGVRWIREKIAQEARLLRALSSIAQTGRTEGPPSSP